MGTFDPPPTLAGYTTFVRTYMQITSTYLPDNSPAIPDSFQLAQELAFKGINTIDPILYTNGVYNLGGAILIGIAPDVGGPPPPPYKNGMPFFEYLRSKFGVSSFVGGTIQSTADESTSESLNVPEFLKNLSLMDLGLLKTPWGRAYLEIAQSYGSFWALT